jgi:hypothetical protein
MLDAKQLDLLGELDHLRICLSLAEDRGTAPEALEKMRAEIVQRERSAAFGRRRLT